MMRRSLIWFVNFEAVFMPALSPSMETGTVVEWKKKVGDLVKENDVFCTIQTDKAVVDYTNTFEPGYLAKIFVQNGQTAAVAKTIAVMVDDAADVAKADEFKPDGEEAAEEEAAPAAPAAAAATSAAPAAAAPAGAAGGVSSEPPEGVDVQAVFMPALSPSMETGTVVEWKKKVGDLVKENEVFCTIQTDKAVVDYTNTFEPGYLAKIFCENGQSGEVAKTIALMVSDPSEIPKVAAYVPEDAVGADAAKAAATAVAPSTPAASPAAPAAASAAGGVSSEPPEGVDVQAVFMPALSPSMETGTVVEWKKKVGDLVKENEVFCTIQTDKAVVDYTNTFEPGYLAKIFCENGQSGEVAKTIALMVSDPSEIPKVASYVPEDAVGAGAAQATAAAPAAAAAAPAAGAPKSAAPAGGKVKRYGNSLEEAVHASGPSVIRIAAGLDDAVLEKIVPTGKDGRFRKEDFQGQPGFDYNDPNVTIKHHAGGTSSSSSASAAKASPTATGLKAATSVGSQAGGNIYNVVISAGKVKKPIDDTPILRKLISTMPIPKPKNAKKAA